MRHVLSPTATLYHADCRDVLKSLPDNSVDSVPTDPPYALVSIVKRFGNPNAAPAKGNDAYMRASAGFMGQTWDTGEVAFSAEFWAEVLRVLKPGGFVAAFGASRSYHRMACAIEDAGFEIRDSLMWLYGTGFPKSHSVALDIETTLCERIGDEWRYKSDDQLLVKGQWRHPAAIEWDGWGTALKPGFEPIVFARKPLSEDTVVANVLRWGTGAINIDACRIPTAEGDSNARVYTSKRTAPGATQNATGERHGAETFQGESKDGRWPANVLTDGSADVASMFPQNTSPPPRKTKRSPDAGNRNDYGTFKGQADVTVGFGDSGSAARFFYSAKASKADRNGSKHPTVKPVSLMEWLVTLITPPGGTVLDPFAGSGTTGAAATRAGFRAIMCEREAQYVQDIKQRFTSSDSVDIERLQSEVNAMRELAALKVRLRLRA